MIDIVEIIEKIRQKIVEYTGNEELASKITNNINVEFVDYDEFKRLTSSAPTEAGGFYNPANKTICLLKKEAYSKRDIHKLIHEMLHAYSDESVWKQGLEVRGYNENDNFITAGGTINEAATEYLASIINEDGFIGYPEDMKYIFELFIDVLNIRTEFVNIYFQPDFWITDEMNKRFNSLKEDQLDDFVLEFDNRLPLFRKKDFDFNKTISILLDAVYDKTINNTNVDYQSIAKDLFYIRRCDFDMNQENQNKIKYLEMVIEVSHGAKYVEPKTKKDSSIGDGKVSLEF